MTLELAARETNRYFFDTEFIEDGKTIDLISIGMVSEDGREYYAVSSEFDASKASDWVKTNVLDKIASDQPRKTREQIRQDILAFVGESPEFWAYYADYDWVVLCQLHGRMIDLPKGWPMFCRDLMQLAEGYERLPDPDNEHHALADAKWTRDCYWHVRQQIDSSPDESRLAGDQIESILRSFAEARLHGQQKYGGRDPDRKDLKNSLEDWMRWATDHMERAVGSGDMTMDCRDHLVKAGGLLLSAVWTQDIRSGREHLPSERRASMSNETKFTTDQMRKAALKAIEDAIEVYFPNPVPPQEKRQLAAELLGRRLMELQDQYDCTCGAVRDPSACGHHPDCNALKQKGGHL